MWAHCRGQALTAAHPVMVGDQGAEQLTGPAEGAAGTRRPWPGGTQPAHQVEAPRVPLVEAAATIRTFRPYGQS
jgi:hypothetical protein